MASILIVVQAFDPCQIYGGQAVVAADHARLLAARGHRVTVLTSNLLTLRPPLTCAEREREQHGYRVCYLPTWIPYPHFAVMRVLGVRAWLREHARGFDLAHVHLAREDLPTTAGLTMARTGLPFVAQTHGNFHAVRPQHRAFDALFSRRVLRAARRVLALQEVEAEHIRVIEPAARLTVVPNGLDVPSQPAPRSIAEPPVVLFVGRMSRVKNLLLLVESARLLAEAGLRPQYRIIGHDAGDGAEAAARCQRYGLSGQFTFLGALSRQAVLQEMRASSLYVQPSMWESFSLTTFEALGLGIPSVVTSGNDLSPLFRARHACAVVDLDAAQMADAMRGILTDPARARALSQRGRALAEEFTLDGVISRLEAVYSEVLTRATA